MTIEIGSPAPDFTLKNQHGEDISLSSFRGESAVVLVFFPFAFSGICTGELCEIRDNLADLEGDAGGTTVLAVSCDHFFSNRAFAERDGYTFSILSDFWPHGDVSRAYGTFNEGAGAPDRGTYVIDREGVVRWKIENGIPDARSLQEYRAALADLA
ncbi:antioxidant, AhpC/TSA family [Aeromicrobium marinum DSM 15272]|uniref:Alkyl hydroperoxide reductase E n=1 Tax=Aeromicrobium marinum DSM 15272 TaxID=585531 RepID=E2SAW8_9ACTN|nr:peroxiredoxin [Aeromicrobium marinum]EFQ83514.1 antioxidant, AhpC/TSA family [Aeromicrobium marinum DSM 15272]